MPQTNIKKSGNQRSLSTFSAVSTRANDEANAATDMSQSLSTCSPTNTNSEVAKELARMSKVIQDTFEIQDKKLDDIKRSTSATETKLSEIAERLNHVEGRLAFLEDANQELQDNPRASKEEVEQLRLKLDDLENRERRNNLRFIGFPEGCEGKDAQAFLCKVVPEIFGIDFTQSLEIDRAHRIGARRPPGPDRQPRPRALIARFLRFQDRERIANAARQRKTTWDGHNIMVFPDYSRRVNEKRLAFSDCKKLLHDRQVKFSLVYPAHLIIHTPEGRRTFEDPKKALSFIRSLG